MSPIDKLKEAFVAQVVDPRQRDRTDRPRRRDLNELAAEEYRRAFRSVLRANGEYRVRLV